MRIGSYEFRPGLPSTLAVLILLPLLVGLGLWQQDRAAQKQAMHDDFEARREQPAILLEAAKTLDESWLYRKVTASGTYDAAHVILLDNRVDHGQAGYHVYTALRQAHGGPAILVNRGWVPVGASRAVLPGIETPTDRQRVEGTLSNPASSGVRLAGEQDSDGWPRVVQRIEFDHLAQVLGYPLMPMELRLDATAPAGYLRDWRLYDIGPERHLGYAFQWFALAVALVIIYLAANSTRVGPDGESQQ